MNLGLIYYFQFDFDLKIITKEDYLKNQIKEDNTINKINHKQINSKNNIDLNTIIKINNSKDLDYYQQQIKEKNNEKQYIMAKMVDAYGKKGNYHLNEYCFSLFFSFICCW